MELQPQTSMTRSGAPQRVPQCVSCTGLSENDQNLNVEKISGTVAIRQEDRLLFLTIHETGM